jgi:hypothetical protein
MTLTESMLFESARSSLDLIVQDLIKGDLLGIKYKVEEIRSILDELEDEMEK